MGTIEGSPREIPEEGTNTPTSEKPADLVIPPDSSFQRNRLLEALRVAPFIQSPETGAALARQIFLVGPPKAEQKKQPPQQPSREC